MAWGSPEEPPLPKQRVKGAERKLRLQGRDQADTELTGKVPDTLTTGVGDRSQLLRTGMVSLAEDAGKQGSSGHGPRPGQPRPPSPPAPPPTDTRPTVGFRPIERFS